MTTTRNSLFHPFSHVKRAATVAWLTWQINDLATQMDVYCDAMNEAQRPDQTRLIERELRAAILSHSKLCARRDALKHEVH